MSNILWKISAIENQRRTEKKRKNKEDNQKESMKNTLNSKQFWSQDKKEWKNIIQAELNMAKVQNSEEE